MGLFVIILLVISAVILLISRRNTETILIAALNFSLAEFWYIMLIYISKKGGFTVQMEKLLFDPAETSVSDLYAEPARFCDGCRAFSFPAYSDVAGNLLQHEDRY